MRWPRAQRYISRGAARYAKDMLACRSTEGSVETNCTGSASGSTNRGTALAAALKAGFTRTSDWFQASLPLAGGVLLEHLGD